MSTILELTCVCKDFASNGRYTRAVDHVSMSVAKGECLAIVGESGSGKSTIANMILGIYGPTSGSISFAGEILPEKRERRHRRAIQLVQQNPLSSLNPQRSIGASLRLALDVHQIGDKVERAARVETLLKEVGLEPDYAARSPSSLSGGQRQRVAIARALACDSELVVLDEPTSALDVLVQARVLRLLMELKVKRDLTYIFITHDLSVVRNIADRVAVFERGRLIEMGATETVFSSPTQAYTRRLISAVPVVSDDEAEMRRHIMETTHA